MYEHGDKDDRKGSNNNNQQASQGGSYLDYLYAIPQLVSAIPQVLSGMTSFFWSSNTPTTRGQKPSSGKTRRSGSSNSGQKDKKSTPKSESLPNNSNDHQRNKETPSDPYADGINGTPSNNKGTKQLFQNAKQISTVKQSGGSSSRKKQFQPDEYDLSVILGKSAGSSSKNNTNQPKKSRSTPKQQIEEKEDVVDETTPEEWLELLEGDASLENFGGCFASGALKVERCSSVYKSKHDNLSQLSFGAEYTLSPKCGYVIHCHVNRNGIIKAVSIKSAKDPHGAAVHDDSQIKGASLFSVITDLIKPGNTGTTAVARQFIELGGNLDLLKGWLGNK